MIHVPEGTFIHNYMQYLEEQECPRIYDFMTACWCLSNALGRHTVVDRPRAPVHLNMYVILVSESGIMRKSTSIRICTQLLRTFLERTKSKTILVETKATRAEILNELSHSTRLHGQAHLTFSVSELATAFGRGGNIGNVVALLTDLYDCPDARTGTTDHETKVTYNLRDVYCGFLAGSTPAWLSRTVTPTIIEGGFTSRCYFVIGKQRKRSIAWPEGQADSESRESLVAQLEEIHAESRTHSRIGITRSARDYFTNWYESRTLHRDTYRESFESREDAHVLRFAGLFAANERSWQISDDHIRRATVFVADLKDAGTQLFTSVRDTNTSDLRYIKRLREVILQSGDAGVARANLSRIMNPTGARTGEFRATLHVMHELDLIRVVDAQYEGMRGRPKRTYYATEYLKNEQFLEDVVRKLGLES